MLKMIPAAGLASILLVVSACGSIPYYDQSLGWFSWSDYDPEIRAIEAAIPAQPMGGVPVLRDARGEYVMATPPAGASVSLNATPVASRVPPGSITSVADDPTTDAGTDLGDPLVGIRNSVSPSVTWRSARGTP